MLRELFIVVILSILTQAVTVSITLTERQSYKLHCKNKCLGPKHNPKRQMCSQLGTCLV